MLKLILFCLFILPGCWTQDEVEGEVYVSIDISQSRAHVGDHVTMVCRVADMPQDGFIYWFKTVMADDQDYIDHIAASLQPLPPYDVISRMKFASVTTGNSRMFTLTIEGVTEEDTGHYGCSYREMSDNVYETEIFDVYSQVDNITVYVDGVLVGDEGLVVTAGEPVNLQIWAGYSVPAPIIFVYVDEREITREFGYDTKTHVRCPSGTSSKTCPLHYLRSANSFGVHTFNGSQDGASFVIKTKVTGSGFESFNKTIPLVVNHAPLFKCWTQQAAKRHSNYTLTCKARGRPSFDLFYWRLFKDGEVTYAFPESYVQSWNAFASVHEEDLYTYTVSLKLYNVTAFHYTEYELVVGNAVGNSSLNITLYEDFTPTSGPSSAGFVPANICLIFILLLLTILPTSN